VTQIEQNNIPTEVEEFIFHAKENPQLAYLHHRPTNSHICLVGVSHKHKEYPAVVRQVLQTVVPQKVVVELDPNRAKQLLKRFDPYFSVWPDEKRIDVRLQPPSFWARLLFMLAEPLILKGAQNIYKDLEKQEGKTEIYGYEMYTALQVGMEVGARIVPADRTVSETIRAFFEEGATDALITQRDQILCDALWDCQPKEPKVVGVVGIGHLAGIEEIWRERTREAE